MAQIHSFNQEQFKVTQEQNVTIQCEYNKLGKFRTLSNIYYGIFCENK